MLIEAQSEPPVPPSPLVEPRPAPIVATLPASILEPTDQPAPIVATLPASILEPTEQPAPIVEPASSDQPAPATAAEPTPPARLDAPAPPVPLSIRPLSDEIPTPPPHRAVSAPMRAAQPRHDPARREPDAPVPLPHVLPSAPHRDRMRDSLYELTRVRTDSKTPS